MSLRADLHVHTSISDGIHSPAEVVTLACLAGLDVLAITDHDVVEGVATAQVAARDTGLLVIPGVELSTEMGARNVHILGYWIDVNNEALQRQLSLWRAARVQRAQEMLDRLAALRMPLEWERVLSIAGEGSLGRPHIASAMVEAGYVTSVDEAFDNYLGRGCPAYVPRAKVFPQQAIAIVRQAGGVPVLAHPWPNLDNAPALAAAGLMGIEAYYTGYTPEINGIIRRLAGELHLFCTGGSDFHGLARLPQNTLGGVDVPAQCVMDLLARRPA